MKLKIKKKQLLFIIPILSIILLTVLVVVFSPWFKSSADIYTTCFPGQSGIRSTTTGNYTGVGGTVKLGEFEPDPDRFYINKSFNPQICSPKDNPSIYLGLKEAVNGVEVDAGLSWEVSKDEQGKLSTTQNSFRPFWRDKTWHNAPAEPRYTWYSGDTVTMELSVPKDGYINLLIKGAGKQFQTSFPIYNIKKNSSHITKIVNAIDQANNEGKPTQPTNAKIIGTNWSERYLFSATNQKIALQTSLEKSLMCFSQNIRISGANQDTGSRSIDIIGTPPTTPNKSECTLTDNLVKISVEPRIASAGERVRIETLPTTSKFNQNNYDLIPKNYQILLEQLNADGSTKILNSAPLDMTKEYTLDKPIISSDWTVPEKLSPESVTFQTRIAVDNQYMAEDKTDLKISTNKSIATDVSPLLALPNQTIEVSAIAKIPRIPLNYPDQPSIQQKYNLLIEAVDTNGAVQLIKSEPFDTTKDYAINKPILKTDWTVPEKAVPGSYTFQSRIVDTSQSAILKDQANLTVANATIRLDVPATGKEGSEVAIQVVPEIKLPDSLPRANIYNSQLSLAYMENIPDSQPVVLTKIPFDITKNYPVEQPVISTKWLIPEKATPQTSYHFTAVLTATDSENKEKEIINTAKTLAVTIPDNLKVVDNSSREIIINTPASFKVGQNSNIQMQYKNLQGYKYHLWVSGTSSGCKNLENGLCFFEKTNASITSNNQGNNYTWQTQAAGTKVGSHLIRVKAFQETGNDTSVFCKREGTVTVVSNNPAAAVNINAGPTTCFASKNSITAAQGQNKDITVNFGEFYNVYSPSTFIVQRNGSVIGKTSESTYLDRNVADGEYEYTVSLEPVLAQKESFLKKLLPIAYAAGETNPSRKVKIVVSVNGTKIVDTDLGPVRNIGEFLSLFFKWAIPITGSLSVLMLIYAGYLYMTSQGNQEGISTAKEIITGVVVGVLLLFTISILLTNIIGTLR